MTPNMIGVRFREASKIYHFAPPADPVREGEYVIVETARGLEMARVVTVPLEDAGPVPRDARPVVRLADGADRDRADEMRDLGQRVLERTRASIVERGLPMYIAAVQINLAGSEATCYFQADGHVDFMAAVETVEAEFDVRMHMQQAGPRDRAKLVDGHDICGLRLCCASWMTSFPKVGIRMAKEQSLALNPDKISGVCGRLLCCLTFEYDVYREMRGSLPKVGKRVSTPAGMGKVVQANVLKQTIMLQLDDHAGRVEVPALEIGMAVRVEERPNGALEETLSDILPGRADSRSRDETKSRDETAEPRRRRRRGRGRRTDGGSARLPGAESAPAPGPEGEGRRDGPDGARPGRRRRRGRRGGAGEAAGETSERGGEAANRGGEASASSERTGGGEAPPPSDSAREGTDGVRRRRRRRRGRGRGSGERAPGDGAAPGDASE